MERRTDVFDVRWISVETEAASFDNVLELYSPFDGICTGSPGERDIVSRNVDWVGSSSIEWHCGKVSGA